MKSILLKDYLEQRIYFFILLAVAVASLLIAAYLKQLDSGIAMILLFALQGPLFVYLTANHQINNEVTNNTLPFLNALPISPFRLWLSKLIFVAVYSTLLYVMYIAMAVCSGVDINELINLFYTYPALGIGIPAVAMAFGFFTTMLPRGFAMLSFLLLAPIAAPVFLSPFTILSINYNLMSIFSIILFLTLSAIVFLRDRSMSAPWRGPKGLLLLFLGVLVFIGTWHVIDQAAEGSSTGTKIYFCSWIPTNGGKSIIWNAETETRWWDVIRRGFYDYNPVRGIPGITSLSKLAEKRDCHNRLVLQNLQTGSTRQIANRHSNFEKYKANFNNQFSRVSTAKIICGFYRYPESTIIDSEGNTVMILPNRLSKDGKIHELGHDFMLIDDKRFIYLDEIKNGATIISEFHLYEKGKGDKVVFSTQDDFSFSRFVKTRNADPTKPAECYIAGLSDLEPDKTVLVSVTDGKKTVLPVSVYSKYLLSGTDFFVVEDYKFKKSKDYQPMLTQVYLDGRTIALDWVNPKSQLLGVNSTGKIIALAPDLTNNDPYDSRWESIIEINTSEKSVRELVRFPQPFRVAATVNQEKTLAVLKMIPFNLEKGKTEPAKRQFKVLNLDSGELKELTDPGNRNGFYYDEPVYAVGNANFMAQIDGIIYQIDAEKLTVNSVVDINTFAQRLDKGGIDK